MCVSISASVALVCLFAPKLYIVLLQPHKNVRQGATSVSNSKSALSALPYCGRQNSFGSFPFQNGGVNVTTTPIQTTQPMQTTNTTINDVFSDSLEDLSCDENSAINNDNNMTEADI